MKKRWIALTFLAAIAGCVSVYGSTDFGSDVLQTKVQQIDGSTVRFLRGGEAAVYLNENSDFSIYNEQLDLSLRLEEDRSAETAQANDRELRRLVEASATDWHSRQIAEFEQLLAQAAQRMEKADLCLWPETLTMVKTDGSAQFGAFHTIGSAIVVPSGQMKFLFVPPRRAELEKTLAHEIWHIRSRSDPELRDRAYAIFGFRKKNGLDLPTSVRAQMIADPDIEDLGYVVEVETASGKIDYLLGIRSAHATYEGLRSPIGLLSPLADYMEAVIYPVDGSGKVLDRPEPLDTQLDAVIGTISSYRLGPDEVVAAAVEALIDWAEGNASYPETERNAKLLEALQDLLSCEGISWL